MDEFYREAVNIAGRLEEKGVRYALCGGLAVGMYTEPRGNFDMEFIVDPDTLPEALSAMEELHYETAEEIGAGAEGELRILRLEKFKDPENKFGELEIMMPSRECFPRAWNWVNVKTADSQISVVSKEGLIEIKEKRSLPQDLADVEILRL